MILAAATAGAATLITGADIRDGSIARVDTNASIKFPVPVRVSGALPRKGFEATNASVSNTPDGWLLPSQESVRRDRLRERETVVNPT